MKNQLRQPPGVTFFALQFLFIGCGGTIIFPVVFTVGGFETLWNYYASSFIHSGTLLHGTYWALVFVWYASYLLYAVIGYGLWKLRNWARRGVQAVFLLAIFVSLVVIPVWGRPLSLMLTLLFSSVALFALQFWYFCRPSVRFAFGAPMTLTERTPIAGPPPKPKRFQWIWAAVAVCAVFAVSAVGLYASLEVMFRESDAYKMALALAQDCPVVTATVGAPFTASDASGSMEESGKEGRADLDIPIHGFRGKGDLVLHSRKTDGTWKIDSMFFQHGDSTDPIVTGGESKCVQP